MRSKGVYILILRILCLMPIPLVWVLLDQPWDASSGPIDTLKDTVMDWRFKVRGPIEAKDVNTDESVKIAYVNFDEDTIAHLGERPWNRKVYADVAAALIQIGGSSVVGFDFILSSLIATDMIPQENIHNSNEYLAQVMRRFPDNIVLATAYTRVKDESYMDVPASFPYLREGHSDPLRNAYPEMPSEPIMVSGKSNVGLIDADLGSGSVPRYVPVFAKVEGAQHSKNLAVGMKNHLLLEDSVDIKEEGDNLVVVSSDGAVMKSYPKNTKMTFLSFGLRMLMLSEGLDDRAITILSDRVEIRDQGNKVLYSIPLKGEQLLEVNWFAPWIITDNKNPFFDKQDYQISVKQILDYWYVFQAAANVPFDNKNRNDLEIIDYIFDRVTRLGGTEMGQEMNKYLSISKMISDQGRWDMMRVDPNFEMADLKGVEDATEASNMVFMNVLQVALQFVENQDVWEAFISDPKNARLFREDEELKKIENPENSIEVASTIYSMFQSLFHDTMILVGPTDSLLQDLAPTPFDSSPVPKVGVHANVLKTISSGLYIESVSWRWNVVLIVLFSILAALGGLYHEKYYKIIAVLCVSLLCGYVAFNFYIFNNAQLVLPMVVPMCSAVLTGIAGLIWRVVHEEKQKGRIKGMFGTYLSQELVNTMVESGEEPQLGGVDMEITAFFSDVQGFSGFSEKLEPHQLVDLMNEYLTAMTEILMDSGCYVDKYIGDAVVGIFNAPVALENHALKACISSMHQHRRLAELREKWKSEGDKWPSIVSVMQARLGMHTGHATVGNMGSGERFNYTMMGDNVNLAARCESGAKAYGVYSMITGETKNAAAEAGDDCVFRYLDKIIVKGRSKPAEVYEIVCLKEDLNAEIEKCLEVYNGAVANYLKQNWDKAHEEFEAASKLEPNRPELNDQAPTTPSSVMMKRTLEMKANPPGADWDGVYVMTTK